MKRGIVEVYKKVVIWVSLILVLWGLAGGPIASNFSNAEIGSTSWWIVIMILPFIFSLIKLLFLFYSLIMLVYILAKKIKEEYIFGFVVPILLFGIPFLIDNIKILNFMYIEQTFFIAILFLYALYHNWKE